MLIVEVPKIGTIRGEKAAAFAVAPRRRHVAVERLAVTRANETSDSA
ncbi:hypothetical protein [Defluviimonas sp. WL0075]|uniref:Uncharacterized protein n=1 Tax=Albidovulum sediminicola TaxID=2984331 RepID=A0ABT2Z5Y6_9RHOB|nr:hypothetical protein [Defluviimonas sp. WL0075]MCV2866564.1 hypothetical protein [Defluviimonas sp. WL0075]